MQTSAAPKKNKWSGDAAASSVVLPRISGKRFFKFSNNPMSVKGQLCLHFSLPLKELLCYTCDSVSVWCRLKRGKRLFLSLSPMPCPLIATPSKGAAMAEVSPLFSVLALPLAYSIPHLPALFLHYSSTLLIHLTGDHSLSKRKQSLTLHYKANMTAEDKHHYILLCTVRRRVWLAWPASFSARHV